MLYLIMLRNCFIVIFLLCLFSPIHATTIYRYVDEQGVIHFTDVMPDRYKVTVIRKKEGKKASPASYYSMAYLKGLADRIARKYSIEPGLVKSVIEKESRWNPYAVSRSGAMGLMQLMPKTARLLGVKNPFDPEENVGAGVRYLKRLIDYFGDIKRALAAYNAGPTTVKRFGGIPPFSETRGYVKEIMYNYTGTGYTSQRSRERIYKIVLSDGTIMFTNSPVYLKNLSSF